MKRLLLKVYGTAPEGAQAFMDGSWYKQGKFKRWYLYSEGWQLSNKSKEEITIGLRDYQLRIDNTQGE